MLDAMRDAIGTLARRIAVLEAQPFNPFSPDCQMFDHFAGDGTIDSRWTVTNILTGSITIPNTTPTVMRLATGATANSSAQFDWNGSLSLVGMAKSLDLVTRFAVTGAIDADDILGVFMASAMPTANDFISIAARGISSTGFWTCYNRTAAGPVTATVTTVAIDTAQHLFRIQTMPDRCRFFIDATQVAEHTTNLPLTPPLQPALYAANGANAGARTMDVDLIWVREAR